MFEPQKMRRFVQSFFHFNRLEEHFLSMLRRMLHLVMCQEDEPVRFLVCSRRRSTPQIEVYASQGRAQQLVTFQVCGRRPVRYHIQTENTALGRKLRRYFSLLLGEENLNLRASSQAGPTLSLVYHVRYPEDVLRELGD